MTDADVAAYIGRWRPSSVSPQAAAFARQVVPAAAPGGRERAKNLLWAAGKLADYAAWLGLDLVPEVVFHPSVIERFARCAPGLSPVARRTLRTNQRFIARRAVPQLYPADTPLPRERAKAPYSAAEISGLLALADAQPTTGRRMRAAGLVCLGAGAGLIRADLRQARGSDIACRSGGVVVAVRGARPRTVPVLSRYHAPLLAAARFAGNGLICCGTDPGRRNLTNPLIRALDGGGGLPGWTRPGCGRRGCGTARTCSGWPRSCPRPGSAAPSGSATSSPGWSRALRPRRCGCSGRPGSDDPAGGVRGDHRRLRRRAADRGHAAHRRAPAAAERPHAAGRHVPDPGRSPARAPDPGAPGAHRAERDDQRRLGVSRTGRTARTRSPTGRPSGHSAWSRTRSARTNPTGCHPIAARNLR